ncbi:CTLH/CRA C-terminal to lish motif domain-containing protein [Podospora conica]|nr:CTLH/CRA C-terminal to lish motif domain-containing protein [Schizothecium conicum]
MVSLQKALEQVNKMPRLSKAVQDVDRIIDLLTQAKEEVLRASDPHTAGLTMTKLQNPTKLAFEQVNNDLKEVSGAHKKLGRAIDKNFPLQPLPDDHDAMADHPALINRAIAMHLLREGQFTVASKFIEEADDISPDLQLRTEHEASLDHDMSMDEDDDDAEDSASTAATSTGGTDLPDLSPLQSQELQSKFSEMYSILQELRNRYLTPAIDWARANSVELETRGSNLEFELSKLQYVWLFKGPAVNGLPDDSNNGRFGALKYAHDNFGPFRARHAREIDRLAGSMAFAPNISASPYASDFAIDGAFSDVAASFTREFCSLLGLSAESPLYIAATAGALALPQLVKFMTKTRTRGTEWTTAHELAFETPLPARMMYHSIFVCPVSKAQTTESNPPMMIPCGHVLSKESLMNLCRGTRFKCPYCPSEGHIRDAKGIIF